MYDPHNYLEGQLLTTTTMKKYPYPLLPSWFCGSPSTYGRNGHSPGEGQAPGIQAGLHTRDTGQGPWLLVGSLLIYLAPESMKVGTKW